MKRIISSFAIALSPYPIFGFISNNYDPTTWTMDGRLILVTTMLFVLGASLTYPGWKE